MNIHKQDQSLVLKIGYHKTEKYSSISRIAASLRVSDCEKFEKFLA